ncbi:MAG TPA: GAF domain-containing sensor histidine kinase [Polyangiaceae bacterium]|nr:GAF domain-containing sensor histidine kinase [Polyangiaceae bacterium]
MAVIPRGPRLLWATLVFAAAVLVASAWGAKQAWGRPYASLFVDPFVYVSRVYLPSWPAAQWGLGGERIVALSWAAPPREGGAPPAERVELGAGGASAIDLFDGAIARARGQGAAAVVAEFESGEARELGLAGRSVGVDELWWFGGLNSLAGVAMLWLGLTAYSMAGSGPGARAHLGLSVSVFVFLTTFFDYHTTRYLAPLFAASTVASSVGLCAVALCFPSPPRLPRPARAALVALGVAGALLALALALAAALGRDVRPLRRLADELMSWSPGVLAVSVLWRLRGARGKARKELTSALWGLVPGPLALTVLSFGSDWSLALSMPFAVTAFPLAIGYGLIRHNIFDTNKPLYRLPFAVPVAVGGSIVAGCVYVLVRGGFVRDGVSAPNASLAAGVVAACAGAASTFALWRVVERVAFSSGARFRPTIEKLADQLAASSDEGAIRVNLCILVQRLLEADNVTFHEPPEGLAGDARWAQLAAGHRVHERRGPGEHLLFAPLRSAGGLLGALCVAPRGEGAPFSAEDLALLDTITTLGVLGINHARAIRRVEELRRFEAEVSEGGQRLTLDLLGAELAHEIAYPLNYFRHLLDRLAKGLPQKADDVEIGREEVERLRRMVAAMRKLRLPSLEHRSIAIAPLVERVLTLLRGVVEERALEVSVDVPAAVRVEADPDRALQLLANLVRNALQAAPEGGRVEVAAFVEASAVVIEVRDDGPGVPEALRDSIFHPWVSDRPGGTGLGLAVSLRIATGFGWRLGHRREGRKTVFRVEAPLGPEPPGERETMRA